MSFRSTFYSPGGFTTQRLDLILKKRKDEGASTTSGGQESGGGGGGSGTTSPTTTSTSNTQDENIKNKHAGALERWRQKMAAQRALSGLDSSSSSLSSSKYRSSTTSLDNDYDASMNRNSLTGSRQRLEYRLDDHYKYNDDRDSQKVDRRHSMVNLPRRKLNRGNYTSIGVNGINSTNTGTIDSNGRLDKRNILDNDVRGSQTLHSERPLISKRFQELFSSGSNDEKEGESGENSPDSLDGDESDSDGKLSEEDPDEVFKPYSLKKSGASLARSLSSASTILRTGWSPSGRLIRDRYNISPSRDEQKGVRNTKGTASNWAAWKGSVGTSKADVDLSDLSETLHSNKDHKVKDENVRNSRQKDEGSKWKYGGSLSPSDRRRTDHNVKNTRGSEVVGDSRSSSHNQDTSSSKQETINKASSNSPSVDNIIKDVTTGGSLPEAIPEDLPVPPTMPPLPTSLHLKSFPGFVQSNNWGQTPDPSSRRIGHWGGHVPSATSGHKPPEWYLYKGSKSPDLDESSNAGQQSLNQRDKSTRPLDFLFHDTQDEKNDTQDVKDDTQDVKDDTQDVKDDTQDQKEDFPVEKADSSTEKDHGKENASEIQTVSENECIQVDKLSGDGDKEEVRAPGVDKESYITKDESHEKAGVSGDNSQIPESVQISENTTAPESQIGEEALVEKVDERASSPSQNTDGPTKNTHNEILKDQETIQTGIKVDKSDLESSPQQKAQNNDVKIAVAEALNDGHVEQSTTQIQSEPESKSLLEAKVESEANSKSEKASNEILSEASNGQEENQDKLGVDSEGAKSPRVSFSDDLKVVPPSPSAKRKQWTTTASETNVEPPTSAGPRPWDKSGKTPVKGILQNGRKEGDLILRPEPDNSEMRRQDSEEQEVNTYVNKRHSFSTTRDMTSTRQRYATFMAEARRGYKPKQTTPNKITTPTAERRGGRTSTSDYTSGKTSTKDGVQMRGKTRTPGTTDRTRRLSWREDETRTAYRDRSSSNLSLSEIHKDKTAKTSSARESTDNIKQDKGNKASRDRVKDLDASGFTISFKDFMEHRKKQGTMVLPKSQEREKPVDKTEAKSKVRGDTVQKSEPQNTVTLNSLKQKRQKELEASHGEGDSEEKEGNVSTAMEEKDAEEQVGIKSKGESTHRWSFRSKSKKKDQEAGETSTPKKKDTTVQSISNFFKRSKKGKKDKDNKDSEGRSVFYESEIKNGARYNEGFNNEGFGTSVSSGQPDMDDNFSDSPPKTDGSTSNSSFTLGPHGHDDSQNDPLSLLFHQKQQSETGVPENSNQPHASPRPERLESGSNTVSVTSDDLLSRSDSPALSAISSTDGAGAGGLNRNKHYQKPDYKHFLDMDSLVASITTSSPTNEAESSSGVSGTGSDAGSVSGIGSLEDLAMALLEQELREEGLLEGEPGKGDPSQNYQDRILSIKTDLQKFSAHLGRALKKQQKYGDLERAPSISEMSLSSTRSSRYGMKDPTLEAKPISDPKLRSKLKTARSPGAKVTSRDQKILELMMQKRESEKAAEAKREALRRAWETEKEHETAVKTSAEVRRRESLARLRHQDKERGPRHGDSRESLISISSERRDSDIDRKDIEEALKYKENKWSTQSQRIMELRPQPIRRPESRILKYRSMDDMRPKYGRPWVAQTNDYQAAKEKKMAERRLQNMQRKKSQEDRIAQQKREQEEVARLVRERQEKELKRANSLKETREQETLMHRKLKNYYHKKKVDAKLTDIKRKSREDVNSLQAAIEMKQATAQSHLNDLTQRRNSSLRRSTTDLDTRISRSRENQQRLQEEITAWHEDLLNYRKSMARKAEEQNKLVVQDKAKKAAHERRHKEKLQRENLKKLLDQEEEWKADVEATIAMKDARARMIQMEKEETVLESRAMAAASQRMREELRSAYSSDNIDQLSRRAEIEAKIGLNAATPAASINHTTKNMSTLTLG